MLLILLGNNKNDLGSPSAMASAILPRLSRALRHQGVSSTVLRSLHSGVNKRSQQLNLTPTTTTTGLTSTNVRHVSSVPVPDAAVKEHLLEFGQFVSDAMPKFVQQVQVSHGNELEVLIAPEGEDLRIRKLIKHFDLDFI